MVVVRVVVCWGGVEWGGCGWGGGGGGVGGGCIEWRREGRTSGMDEWRVKRKWRM